MSKMINLGEYRKKRQQIEQNRGGQFGLSLVCPETNGS